MSLQSPRQSVLNVQGHKTGFKTDNISLKLLVTTVVSLSDMMQVQILYSGS